MHFPCKRFIAHLLLFGQLLSSCVHPVRLRIGHAPRHISNRQPDQATPFIPTIKPTYLAKGSHQVTFSKKEDIWEAQVVENSVPGFRRVLDHLPVHCAPTYSITSLSDYATQWHSNHIHVFFPSSKTGQPGLVYIGKMGLLGGTKIDPSSGSTNHPSSSGSPDLSAAASSGGSASSNVLRRDGSTRTAVKSHQVKEREAAVDETLVGISVPNNHSSNAQAIATTLPTSSSAHATADSSVSVDGVDATAPSGLDDQSSNLSPVSLVDQFLESFTANLSGTDRSGFEEVFVPILKRRLPTANASLQKSIISYFEKGGSFSQPVLAYCPLSDWVKESLIQDLVCGYYEEGNTITYPHFLQQLNQIVGHYQGIYLEQLLLAIRDTAEKKSLGLMEISDLLTFLLIEPDHHAVSSLLAQRASWSTWLPCKYVDHQLKEQKVSLSNEDYLILSKAVSNEKWRPCMIRELVSIINQILDFTPVKDLLNFIQKHGFSGQVIEQALYAYPDDQGISRLNKCLGQLATRVVEDQISALFPDYAASINGQLPSFFTYASPIETLEIFKSFLNSLPQVDRLAPSVSTFNSFLQEIDVDALLNEPISKPFLDAITLLSAYKVDGPTAISAFKLLKEEIKTPNTWEGLLHKLVVSATFKGVKEYTRTELIQQIKDQSPDVSFVSDPSLLEQRCQEVINSYCGASSILPGKPICEWSAADVKRWSDLVKGKTNRSTKGGEALAIIFRAVELHHGYEPRDTQLLTLLTLLNPAEGLGRLAQVNTGEGKSIIIAMLAAVHALQGKKVDIITTSTELTIPEVERQAGFFEMLNLTVGENSRKDFDSEKETIKAVYAKDIVYGTPIDFQGDILRTEFSAMDTREGRKFDIAIVDEVDSMLYDERKHSTRLSSPLPGMDHLALTLGAIWHEVDQLANQIIEKDGMNFYVKVPLIPQVSQASDTIYLGSDAPLSDCLEPIEDIESFVREKVSKEVKQALRDLTPEESKELKSYKLLQKKESEIVNKYRNILNEIHYYQTKISKDYQEWWGRSVKWLENVTGWDLNFKEYEQKLAACQKELPAIEKELASIGASISGAPFKKGKAILDSVVLSYFFIFR